MSREPEPLPKPRLYREVGFDLETTDLKANFGTILCACFKPVGAPVITFRLDEFPGRGPWDDRQLILRVCEFMNSCGKVFGWYSSRFDVKFLRTRKLLNDIQAPCTFAHADLWVAARTQLLLHNNRLDTWNRSFAPSTIQKTQIDWESWRRATSGDEPSIDDVVKHCQMDVESMEYSFLQLDPFIKSWKMEVV